MIQKTFKIKSREEFQKWLKRMRSSEEYKTAHRVLIKGLTAQFMDYDIMEAHNLIVEELPKATVVGMSLTSFGRRNFVSVSNATRYFERYVVASCTFFDKSEITLIECGNEMLETGEVAPYIKQQLRKIPDIKAVEIMSTGKNRYNTTLMEEITSGYEDVPFFGAEAGVIMEQQTPANYKSMVNHISNKNVKQYIIGEKYHSDGVILIVYSGKELSVHSAYNLGWKPLGKEMTVTKTVGGTCIAEIDDIPAAKVYKNYLNVDPDDFFLMNICEFPLLVRRNNFTFARVPPMYDDNGWLYLGSDIYKGEKVRLSYANPQELLRETYETSEQMREFGPEAVYLYICGARSIFLGDYAKEEIDYFQRFRPETTFCHGGAEIYRYKEQGGVLNSSFISIGMREVDKPVKLEITKDVCTSCRAQNHVIPLVDRLATFLKATTDELKELVNVVSDSNHKLRKMAKTAESASKAKSAFLSNMSHEIRTPINAILGMNEMILREAKEPTILEYAENIRNASNSLLGLVNDILDFSKIEAGKMEIIPVEYAFSSLLNDLVNMIQKRAEDKGLKLVVNAPKDLPTILFGDEIRIKQIVTNILTNAVKYTEKGSVTLTIKWRKKNEKEISVGFSVRDTGIGIKQEDISKLFSAFERIEEKRNRSIEGTGLGMNITHQLLRLMGSNLKIESIYGKGSVFSFWIDQEVRNWDEIGDFEESYRQTISQHEEYHEKFTAPDAKILVVDDTVMNLTVMKGLLKQTKIKIYTAESGYECLHLVTKEHYDIIFLDHRMPGIDGIETLHRMKKLPHNLNKHTPVISLTANAVSGAREEYINAGFEDYLTKPINSSHLENMIIKYLPKDKITISTAPKEAEHVEEFKLPEWLMKVEGLDVNEGVEHCGSKAAYMDALTVFAESVSTGAKEIGEYYKNEDWNSYTTKVHALKSSARVIGARELSERARRLEDAGNSGYIDEIREFTAELLQLYMSYEAKLMPLLKREDEDDANKPLISDDELAEAYETMKEMTASFDYDSMMFVIQSLDEYRMPENEVNRYKEIKSAAVKPDWDKIRELLAG